MTIPHLRIVAGRWITACPNCGLVWAVPEDAESLLCVQDEKTPGCGTTFEIPWPEQKDEILALAKESGATWHNIWSLEEFKAVIEDPSHEVGR